MYAPAKTMIPAMISASGRASIREFAHAPSTLNTTAPAQTGTVIRQSIEPRRWKRNVPRIPVKANVKSAVAVALWDALLEAGEADGLVPVGLGARDTLRLEAALPLYGHELTRETSPLEAGLERFVKLDKEDFIGREALLRQRAQGPRRRLVGFTLVDPGIPRQGYEIEHAGRPVGVVTSGTKSPTLGKAMGLGYVTPDCAQAHTRLGVNIRGRIAAAEVVALPFYRRARNEPSAPA